MNNKFPSDDLEDFDALRKGLADVQALLANRAPLTEASKGWILRAGSGPNPSELGPNDVWVGAQGARLVAMDSSGGTIALAPVSFPIAAFQSDPAALTSTSIGATPTAAQYNALRSDLINAINVLTGLIDKLIAGDLMLPG